MTRRVVLPCLLSLLLYAMLFGALLDRPLSLGMFRSDNRFRLARGAAIERAKLVIIAGSNGPYSHRCEVMEPLLGLPCVNAGIAVGIGLDYLFARWRPLLRPGDVVYLPMEEAQYTRTYAAVSVGPDASIMFRHDRETLAALPPDRLVAAAFSFNLRSAVMSVIETALVSSRFNDPREAALGSTNAWGDHVGHTPIRGEANAARLERMLPSTVQCRRLAAGDGTADGARFPAVGGPPWHPGRGRTAGGDLPPRRSRRRRAMPSERCSSRKARGSSTSTIATPHRRFSIRRTI